jgi:hypothetical protein
MSIKDFFQGLLQVLSLGVIGLHLYFYFGRLVFCLSHNIYCHTLTSLLFTSGIPFSDSQARSLASFMHNEDGLLQFYAVHFDYEAMAFHGGDILTKAAYVNTAILAIQQQYKKYRPHEGKIY